jgi:hypothetical protein
MGANGDGATALLLVFCSLDALRRLGGPFGALVAAVSCLLLIVGLVWVIGWANQQTDDDDLISKETSHGAERRHTPTTTASSFWINAIVIFLVLSVITSPSCYYIPRAMRKQPDPVIVDAEPLPTEAASTKLSLIPLTALSPFPQPSGPLTTHAV